MTREQEAIDLLNEHGMPERFTHDALDALLSPSPCPERYAAIEDHADCMTCSGRGTVPPLLRWNSDA